MRISDRGAEHIVIPLLIVIAFAAIAITIWALWFREPNTVLAPDYAVMEEEQYAVPVEDIEGSKLEQPSGGGAVSLTFATEVRIDLSDKKANLFFANPAKSNQDVVIQIAIRDTVVLQSGRLTPGSQVTELDLLNGVDKQLAPGGYDGEFIVLYYQQDTGEKAVVDTCIPISIAVEE